MKIRSQLLKSIFIKVILPPNVHFEQILKILPKRDYRQNAQRVTTIYSNKISGSTSSDERKETVA